MANMYNKGILPSSSFGSLGAPKNEEARHNIDMAYCLFNVNEVSNMLNLSRSQIYNLINSKKLSAYKQGRRTVLKGSDIKSYIDSLTPYEGGMYGF